MTAAVALVTAIILVPILAGMFGLIAWVSGWRIAALVVGSSLALMVLIVSAVFLLTPWAIEVTS